MKNNIEDLIKEDKPACLENKFLTNVEHTVDSIYCTRYHQVGESCPYLRVINNTQYCNYYKK